MSSDQEWAELREVERWFLAEDPTFMQAFEARARELGRRSADGATRVTVGVATALGALLLLVGSPTGAVAVVVVTVLVGLLRWGTDDTVRRPPPDHPERARP
ncbi:MAG: hypothetical protein AVDCRST_MAG66-4575 [uncultured Pseudonocardia sp.]|uniref:DUF3040 domain-containing protein n=1 Tax=uncultured Pseudonocardia sp. TaxID=211455 RepID=A0A6J4QKT7_9PSEU|nr:MAG: hypothetical protein AVDCRST_MAG66-4575 [uncultured Pseudonocardia sp.]